MRRAEASPRVRFRAVAGCRGALLFFAAIVPVAPLPAAAPESALLFESETLRIYRAIDRAGVERIVLTNLDEDGLPLSPTPSGASPPEERVPCRDAGSVTGGASSGPDPATSAENPVGPGEPEGDVTIVININNIPPSTPEPAAVPILASPYFAFGGIAGAFRYPDRHPFLGYGNGVGSPSMFGGLGLNAGNGFGLKKNAGCGQGFDCLFPPRP